MHREPLLLLLGLLLSGSVAPARHGPKRVSAPDPGAGLQRHPGTDGSRLSWRGEAPLLRTVLSHPFRVHSSDAKALVPDPGSQAVTRCIPVLLFPCFLFGSEVFLLVGGLNQARRFKLDYQVTASQPCDSKAPSCEPLRPSISCQSFTSQFLISRATEPWERGVWSF